MVSQAQGGRHGSVFLQTTLIGRVSTHQNQTPTQRRRKRTSQLSSASTRSQRPRFCSNIPSDVLTTRIPWVARLSQHDLHSHNQQSRRRKCTSLPSSDSTRSQRQRLCSNIPFVVLITLIPLVDRLSQHDLHGHNQQAADGDTFGDPYPSSPALNSSIFTFQNIGPQKQSAAQPTYQLNSSRILEETQVFFYLLRTA